jgi:hypothetical protein
MLINATGRAFLTSFKGGKKIEVLPSSYRLEIRMALYRTSRILDNLTHSTCPRFGRLEQIGHFFSFLPDKKDSLELREWKGVINHEESLTIN